MVGFARLFMGAEESSSGRIGEVLIYSFSRSDVRRDCRRRRPVGGAQEENFAPKRSQGLVLEPVGGAQGVAS